MGEQPVKPLEERESLKTVEEDQGAVFSAPDGGWGWMVLLGAFVAYFIADGWSYTFGVFFPVFLHHFQESRGSTAIIGAMAHGVPRLVSPFISAIINAVGCRTVTIVGGLITAVAFVLSAFATSIDYLCFSLGLLASMGFATIYIASLVIVTFYFEKRRGLATGLATTGSGLGAFIFPPMMELCLHAYSWRGTLLLLGAVCLHLVAAGALFRPLLSRKLATKAKVKPEAVQVEVDFAGKPLLPEAVASPPRGNKPTLHVLDRQWSSIVSISSWSLGPTVTTPQLPHRCLKAPEPLKEKASDVSHMDYRNFVTRSITDALDCINSGKSSPDYPSCPDLTSTSDSCPGSTSSSDKPFIISSHQPRSSCHIFKTLCLRTSKHFAQICDKSLISNKPYIIFCISSFVFYFFIIVPYVYLVDFVTQLGYSDSDSAMLLSIIGIGRTVGQIVLGCLGDLPKVNSILIYSVAISFSGIATLLIPVSSNYYIISFTCALFGFAVSGTYVLQMICVVRMVGLRKATNAFGLFQLIPGLATLIGTPVSGWFHAFF